MKTALTPGGRAMLERAATELPTGSEEHTRIESALKAAQLREADPLGPPKRAAGITWIPGQAAQAATFSRIEENAGRAGAADRLIGEYIGRQYIRSFETEGYSEDGAAKSALAVFDKTLAARSSPEERQNLARGVAEAYVERIGDGAGTTDKLLHAAQTPGGRALLERARDTLPQGDEARARLDAALKAAQLYNAPAEELDAGSREAAFRLIGAAYHGPGVNDFVKAPGSTIVEAVKSDTSAQKAENVVALVRSDAFKTAKPDTRRQMLAAVGHHAGDSIFREKLEKLALDPALAMPEQKAAAIQAFDDLASRDGYQGSVWNFNPHVSESARRHILDNAATLVASPGFQSASTDDRQAALAALNDNARSAKVAHSIAALMNTSGFKAADGTEKKAWLEGLDEQAGDRASRSSMDHAAIQYKFGNDTVEFLATRDKNSASTVHVTATYTGAGGINTTTSVGAYRIDPGKPLDLQVTPDGQHLSIQGSRRAMPLDHGVTEETRNGITVRTHSFGGDRKLTLLLEPGPASMADEQPPGGQAIYDGQTELAAATQKVEWLTDSEFSAQKAGAVNALAQLEKKGAGDGETADRAARINGAVTAAAQASDELRAWGKPEDYPPELAGKLIEARKKQATALEASYTSSASDYARARANADRAMVDVNAAAVRNGGPLSQQADLQETLGGRISSLEDKNPSGDEAKRRAQINRILGLTPRADGKPVETVAQQNRVKLAKLREDLAKGDPSAGARIRALYAENQHKINNMAIIAMREQIHKTGDGLNGTFGSAVDQGIGAVSKGPQGPVAERYQKEFDGYLDRLAAAENKLRGASTQQEAVAAAQEWVSVNGDFYKAVNGKQFKKDIANMQDRTAQIDFARTTSIVFVASLAGGLAGGIARSALALSGAGSAVAYGGAFLVEVGTFTVADGTLNRMAGNEVNFGKDLLKNTVMFGMLRGARGFFKEGGSKTLFAAKTTAAELAALQVFSEGEFALEHGRAMKGDERKQAVVNGLAMVVALRIGGKLTEPLTGHLQKVIGDRFAAQRAKLSGKIARLEREGSAASPQDIKETLAVEQEIWNGERVAAEKAVSEGRLTRQEADELEHTRQDRVAEIQLDLADNGISLDLTGGASAYAETRAGEIVYRDAEAAELAGRRYTDFHQTGVNDAGDPVYTGRNAAGEKRLFVPQSSIVGGTRGRQWGRSEKAAVTHEAVDKTLTGLNTGQPGALAAKAVLTRTEGEGRYTLTVPVEGGVTGVDVQIELVDKAKPSVHGDDTGPAVLHIETPGDPAAPQKATIQVEKGLDPKDLPRALRHELDELAIVAARRRANPSLNIDAETKPRLLRGELPAGDQAAVPSAHDIATARELAPALAVLPQDKAWTPDVVNGADPRLHARLAEAGLDSGAGWEGKARALREAGVSEESIGKLRAAASEVGEVRTRARGTIDESGHPFSEEERRIAKVLANEGSSVRSLKIEENRRNPDAEVDGVPTEFKSMQPKGVKPSADSATVKNEVNDSARRGGQARNLILDARGSGLSRDEAERGLARVAGITRGRIDHVRIIGDGFDLTRNYAAAPEKLATQNVELEVTNAGQGNKRGSGSVTAPPETTGGARTIPSSEERLGSKVGVPSTALRTTLERYGPASAYKGGPSGADGRGTGEASGGLGRIAKVVFSARPEIAEIWRKDGISSPDFYELSPNNGKVFYDAINEAKNADSNAAAVNLYPAEVYNSMRLFLTPDGKGGFALKGDDIVSLFRHPKAKEMGHFVIPALDLAASQGGRRLDAFDTVLPYFYGRSGFRAVSRTPFNDEHQPEGWRPEVFKAFNNGKPDVVFMVYDPGYGKRYVQGDGVVAADYDSAAAIQRQEAQHLAQARATSGDQVQYPPAGTILPKMQRVMIFNDLLLKAPAPKSAQEAFDLMANLINRVEDDYSGVEPVENPGLKYEGRMYPPRPDYVTALPGGGLQAITKGNVIKATSDGTIEIYAKNKDGTAGVLLLKKGGKNG